MPAPHAAAQPGTGTEPGTGRPSRRATDVRQPGRVRLCRFYQPQCEAGSEMTTTQLRRDLLEERDALVRWAGEGGAPADPYNTLPRIEARLERLAPSVLSAPAQSARTRRPLTAFEDLTRPAERSFGFYLIEVVGANGSQVLRASHPTARRVARRRTQYGETSLSFLEPIDTPALD